MSGSAALEYGFPSTHSTNAVSVGLYALAALKSEPDMDPTLRLLIQLLSWVYMLTIVFGRLYCGMHGFLDICVGSVLGALLAWIQWTFKREIDGFIYSGDWKVPLIVITCIVVLVRIHPEPADPCPCFDDGVAFAGVVIGVDVGHWHYAQSRFALSLPTPATVPYSWAELGLSKSVLRVLLGAYFSWLGPYCRITLLMYTKGVVLIVGWREVMKPTLHSLLPPIFRFIERNGLSLPRKDYKRASEYTKVPDLVDDTLPLLQELPALIHNFSRRTRSDSVGPQSAADVYETLAHRENGRGESTDSRVTAPAIHKRGGGTDVVGFKINNYEGEMGMERVENVDGNGEATVEAVGEKLPGGRGGGYGVEERREEAEIFMRIEKPRVRYDVEVVTKLFVYSGKFPSSASS